MSKCEVWRFKSKVVILSLILMVGNGCPIPGSVQGQVGWGFEQPGLVEDVPAHGREVGTR